MMAYNTSIRDYVNDCALERHAQPYSEMRPREMDSFLCRPNAHGLGATALSTAALRLHVDRFRPAFGCGDHPDVGLSRLDQPPVDPVIQRA